MAKLKRLAQYLHMAFKGLDVRLNKGNVKTLLFLFHVHRFSVRDSCLKLTKIYSNFLKCIVLNFSVADLAECVGSLSSWKTCPVFADFLLRLLYF